jgi:uncharacterized protein
MERDHLPTIAAELGIKVNQVRATVQLLSDGCTVPFIARYRKESTESLDEVAITHIRDRLEQLVELDRRRDAIVKSLEERDLLTDELRDALLAADTMARLEDLYLPYRPKRRTRGTMAKEKGLEPLADTIGSQADGDPAEQAQAFIDPEKGIGTVEEALGGARDIIAERVSEDAEIRKAMRELFAKKAMIRCRVVSGKEAEGAKFSDYFDCMEDLASAAGHRILAMFRGEREGILTLHIRPPEHDAMALLRRLVMTANNAAAEQVRMAVEDSYKRLLAASMETEIRRETKNRVDEEAIRVFAGNLRELLLAPPLGEKRVLALDPGFRTGAKLVCLDAQGKLLHHETIFPTRSKKEATKAGETVRSLCERYSIEAIAIGNGTASRETESFVRSLELPQSTAVVMVDESGASIYSASKTAREEFPDLDATVRGAVSIGRRLMDPLAELVKIDPKSIGVGQYQHDVGQVALKRSLDDVVSTCVNRVGVDVNTASKELLTYVSGLGPMLAKNIVALREARGAFRSRSELMDVDRLGPKAFEQAAGFLRIRGAANPLDASAVHPESYPIVQQMAQHAQCSVEDLMKTADLREQIRLADYVTENVGLPTLKDIMAELDKPGRDPRETFEAFSFAENVNTMEDLAPGMKLPGIVTNVTAFGAFVDIGVHQDGLVHISQLADRFVKDPAEIVKVRQRVTVTVLEVDRERNRISLSMRRR